MSSEITVLNEIVQEQRAHIAQLVSQVEDLKLQFDLVLNERNEAMDENASAKSVHQTLVRNLTSMSEFAGKAMRERDNARTERDRARVERDEARRMYCEAVILHGTAHRFDANGVPEEITDAKDFARRLHWDCFREAP